MKRAYRYFIPCLLILQCCLHTDVRAQGKEITLNLAPLDGQQLSPDNILAYGIQSGFAGSVNAKVSGTLRYRQSGLSFSYTFNTSLHSGMNMLDGGSLHPQWTFSSGAFRELFLDYKRLPEGTYEYCVTVQPLNQAGEAGGNGESSECLYQKSDDIFLINLVDPENNAKIYEHYPVFSWIVNYPFASQLTYRIRVAEIKEGQNTVGAITRNNPVYQESNLPQTTTTYPVYGTPLKTFQDYSWTIDAYYKGILLGGAEPWKFTIIEDSELAAVPRNPPYIDVLRERGTTTNYAIGTLKMKFELEDLRTDSLAISLSDRNGNPVKLQTKSLQAVYGDNRFDIDLKEGASLKHMQSYFLELRSTSGTSYKILFKYVNPDFLK